MSSSGVSIKRTLVPGRSDIATCAGDRPGKHHVGGTYPMPGFDRGCVKTSYRDNEEQPRWPAPRPFEQFVLPARRCR